jgi:hypothetical protein
MSSQIALTFEPSSLHYIAVDYALVWAAVAVVLVGLTAVSFGIVVTLRHRRAVSSR